MLLYKFWLDLLKHCLNYFIYFINFIFTCLNKEIIWQDWSLVNHVHHTKHAKITHLDTIWSMPIKHCIKFSLALINNKQIVFTFNILISLSTAYFKSILKQKFSLFFITKILLYLCFLISHHVFICIKCKFLFSFFIFYIRRNSWYYNSRISFKVKS